MAALTLDSIDIIDPDLFVQNGYPHDAWTLMRREAPVYWYERPDVQPFWALTKHADIIEVSRQPDLYRALPAERRLLFIVKENAEDQQPEEPLLRQLLNMNPPEHGAYRSVVNRRFTPRAIEQLRTQIEEVTTDVLDSALGK